jgi:hypothetical protein
VPDSEKKRVRALFEVPDFALCSQLQRRLEKNWDARVVGRSESRFVAVEIDPLRDGMEVLVKAVADWAADVGLRYVRFHIGVRMYTVVASIRGDDS